MKHKFIFAMLISIFLVNVGFSASDFRQDSKATRDINSCNGVTVTNTMPFLENFNSISSGIPECWDVSGTSYGSSHWYGYSSGYAGACLRFNSYSNSGGNTSILKTPVLDLTALTDGAVLSFMYKNPEGGDFSVYISTDGGASYTTELANGLVNQSDWIEKEITLPSEAIASNTVIVFKGTSNYGNGDAYIYLDDVKVSKVPTCPNITALEASNITTNSATLSWTLGGSENAWQVYVSDTEITDFSSITPVNVSASSYDVTGLNPSNFYYAYVRAVCAADDASEWETVNFKTLCGSITVSDDAPFMENFNDITSNIPDCWDNADGTTDSDDWKWNYSTNGYNGTKALSFNSYANPSGKTNMLKTPVLDLTALTDDAVLNFMYKNPAGGDFSVYLSTDGGATYTTELATALVNQPDWTEKEISLPSEAIASNIVIVFKGISNYAGGDAYIYLDNVNVSKVPTCSNVTALEASNITVSSANLNWTLGDSENAWQVYISDKEIADFSIITPIDVSESSYNATDLSQSTVYYAYVRAICATDNTSEWEAINFQTLCGFAAVSEDAPFMENFNYITSSIPDCWDNSEGTTTIASEKWSLNNNLGIDNSKCLIFDSYSNLSGHTNFLKTTVLDLTTLTDGAVLSFMYKNPEGGDFSVYLSTDGGASYTTELANGLVNQSDWIEKEITLPSEAISNNTVIVFKGTSNHGSSNLGSQIYLDDVKVYKRALSNEKDILTYSLPGQIGNSQIDGNNHTIAINIPSTTYITNIVASFTLSDGATAKIGTVDQGSGTTANDFTNDVVYTIVAENGTTQDWTVTVNAQTLLYTVTFNVTDGSDALENVNININSEDLTTNASGEATIDLANGNYTYTTTLANYTDFTGKVTVADMNKTVDITLLPTSIAEVFFGGVSIVPNPTKGILRVTAADLCKVEILDMTGKVLYNSTLSETTSTLDISNYKSGIYFVRLTKNNQFVNYKVVKE